MLKYLQLKEGSNKIFISKPLDVDECKVGWKKAKERTSSAMQLGTHFGHWKVGYTDDEIAGIHTEFVNIPFITGYYPKRWQVGINSLLTKEHGNFRID